MPNYVQGENGMIEKPCVTVAEWLQVLAMFGSVAFYMSVTGATCFGLYILYKWLFLA